ncbi:MAG: hypothetical protein M1831_003227 [Alyxoria varia]|nr:MAG: hypothetical protein M1831_003227 [Alyxoria varia]
MSGDPTSHQNPSPKPTGGSESTSLFHKAQIWGRSSLPPALLATLIFPQHMRPAFQAVPMLFPPALLFTSYVNLNGYKTDAGGLSAVWSTLYLLLASRRHHRIAEKLSPRGVIRGATLAVAGVNGVAGAVTYAFGTRGRREEEWIGKDSGEE